MIRAERHETVRPEPFDEVELLAVRCSAMILSEDRAFRRVLTRAAPLTEMLDEAGLRALNEAVELDRAVAVYLGNRRLEDGTIDVLPLADFLDELGQGHTEVAGMSAHASSRSSNGSSAS